MRAIIIDDEGKARRILEALIDQNCEDVDVVGVADDVPSGVKAINKEYPDVVFLDIEMPGYSGFQLLDFFDEIDFDIIFTTAYSEHALKAFEVSAIDYLLKPIQIDQLVKAVNKVRAKKAAQINEKIDTLKENLKGNKIAKIALPVADGLLFVKPEEILYLKAESSYTNIYLIENKTILVSKTLKEFEKLIDHPHFMRIHRSYFVNLNHIKQYYKSEGGHIEMINGDIVYFSKDKKEEMLAAFKTLMS
ncbi:MAG: response regulator transcription factor [Bacteroidia bacterium]